MRARSLALAKRELQFRTPLLEKLIAHIHQGIKSLLKK
jgi:hypothetical protein